tara:strand:+ start:310 stop:501 length:192 start_codon:yes stop_codon:yes gene_type:complete
MPEHRHSRVHYNSVAASNTGSLWVKPIYELDHSSGEVTGESWSSLFYHADEEMRATKINLIAF